MDPTVQSSTATGYLFKILSGPHQGAELLLQEGTLTIGSHPDCDVILSDALIAPKHLELSVQGNAVFFQPLQEPVYLNGSPTKLEKQPLPALQVLTLGTTHMVVGPQQENWPQIELPELQSPKPTAEADKNEAPAAPSNEAAPAASASSTAAPSAATPGSTEPTVALKVKAGTPKKSGRGKKLLLNFLIFLFACVVGGIALSRKESKEPPRVSKLQDVHDIQEQLESVLPKLGSIDQLEIQRSGASIEVRGYVDSINQKREVIGIVSKISRSVKVTIWSQEEIVRSCEDMLSVLEFRLRITPYGPGTVKINGYHANRGQWLSVKQNLVQDIVGLKFIKDEVITEKEVMTETMSVLLDYDLNDKILITADPAGIIATGSITSSLTPAWKEAQILLAKRLDPDIPIIDRVKVPNAAGLEKIFFDSKIESVTIDNETSWLTLHNGSTYFQGSGLPSGYTIDAIRKDGVVLRRGKDSVTLKIGDKL